MPGWWSSTLSSKKQLSVLAVHSLLNSPTLGQKGIDFPGQAGLDIPPF